MSVGPISGFVIGFPDSDLFEGRIADELARLSEVGQIRVIDAVFVMRDGDDVAALSVSDLDDEQRNCVPRSVRLSGWASPAPRALRLELRSGNPPMQRHRPQLR